MTLRTIIFAAVLLACGRGWGASYTWTPGTNGNWSTASNWGGTVPGVWSGSASPQGTNSDTVVISTGTCAMDAGLGTSGTLGSITGTGTGYISYAQAGVSTTMSLTSGGTAILGAQSTSTNPVLAQTAGTLSFVASNATAIFGTSGNGWAFSSAGATTINGNAIQGGSTSNFGRVVAVNTGANVTFIGLPKYSGGIAYSNGYAPLWINGGILNWTGTLTNSSTCVLAIYGGTLNTNGLSLSNSGVIAVIGTPASFIPGTGSITNATSAAQAAAIGFSWGSGFKPYMTPGSLAISGGSSSTVTYGAYFTLSGGTIQGTAPRPGPMFSAAPPKIHVDPDSLKLPDEQPASVEIFTIRPDGTFIFRKEKYGIRRPHRQ